MSNAAVICKDEKYYEIIGGKKYMPPSPILHHFRSIKRLDKIFENLLADREAEFFFTDVDVMLRPGDTVKPDFFIVCDPSKTANGKNIQGAPDFITEVLSPGNSAYDLVTKKILYQKFGVKEYWIVDNNNKNIHVYTLKENGEYGDPEIYHYFSPDEIEDIEKSFDDYLKEQIKITEIVSHTFGDEIRVPIAKIFENLN